jgi:hypothetical protein
MRLHISNKALARWALKYRMTFPNLPRQYGNDLDMG